uniref:Uncharacterized protein n=1 Tax=Coturnix japonica TaxID=93934 RepID=A0A8C2TSM7_COTJA
MWYDTVRLAAHWFTGYLNPSCYHIEAVGSPVNADFFFQCPVSNSNCSTFTRRFAALQSNVQSSLVRILKAREKLTSLQALEGSRELENIIGDSDSSCDLSAEVQKTQALMIQAEELQLLKRNHGQRPAREHAQPASSSAFLQLLLDSL